MQREIIIECAQCHRTMRKEDSFTVVDKKDGYKKKVLCRDCQVGFYLDEIGQVGIQGEGAAKVRLFSKNLKDGK